MAKHDSKQDDSKSSAASTTPKVISRSDTNADNPANTEHAGAAINPDGSDPLAQIAGGTGGIAPGTVLAVGDDEAAKANRQGKQDLQSGGYTRDDERNRDAQQKRRREEQDRAFDSQGKEVARMLRDAGEIHADADERDPQVTVRQSFLRDLYGLLLSTGAGARQPSMQERLRTLVEQPATQVREGQPPEYRAPA